MRLGLNLFLQAEYPWAKVAFPPSDCSALGQGHDVSPPQTGAVGRQGSIPTIDWSSLKQLFFFSFFWP